MPSKRIMSSKAKNDDNAHRNSTGGAESSSESDQQRVDTSAIESMEVSASPGGKAEKTLQPNASLENGNPAR